MLYYSNSVLMINKTRFDLLRLQPSKSAHVFFISSSQVSYNLSVATREIIIFGGATWKTVISMKLTVLSSENFIAVKILTVCE